MVNAPFIDVSRTSDGKFLTERIQLVHQARSSQAPFTLDVVIEAEFFIDPSAETLTITDIVGQENINFFQLLETSNPLFRIGGYESVKWRPSE